MNQPAHKSGFHISVSCPGCGGELELQSDFFSLQCEFCGSVLRVVMPDTPPVYYIPLKAKKRELRFQIDRFLKKAGKPLTNAGITLKHIYYPYWKIDAVKLRIRTKPAEAIASNTNGNIFTTQIDYRGMFPTGRALGKSMTSKPAGMDEKKISVKLSPYMTTMAAAEYTDGIPPSLGRRTDYIAMYPLTVEKYDENIEYLPVAKSYQEIAGKTGNSIRSGVHAIESKKRLSGDILFPEGSIVYFPYAIFEDEARGESRRFVCDGVTGRVVSFDTPKEAIDEQESQLSSLANYGQVTVTMHRCKNCGVDLPPEESCVYICKNCHAVVSIDKDLILENGVSKIIIPDAKTKNNEKQFPFWMFKAPEKLINKFVSSYHLKMKIDKIVVPGFWLSNLDAMRRLSKRITAAGSQLDSEPVMQYDKRFIPITVGLKRAQKTAGIIMYCSQAIHNANVNMESFEFESSEAQLVYIPFYPEHYFYICSANDSVTFEKRSFGQ